VSTPPDVVVIGAGIVGAACAYYAASAGLSVTVLDRGQIAGGTTSAGEGNLLVSDKPPGPELALTLTSLRLWRELGAALGGDAIELDAKGGLVVATSAARLADVVKLAEAQRDSGVDAIEVDPDDLDEYEPRIAPDLAGAVYYPQDLQVQPMLAAAHLLRASRATLRCGVEVAAIEVEGRVKGVRTTAGETIPAGAVVNAAGTWGGGVAALAGVPLPIAPRRGFILVTEPLGGRRQQPPIRHKVYAADYVSTVVSDEADLQMSTVVEGTRAGTVLIGASRERVGFAWDYPLPVLRQLAAQAIALFPFLARVTALRAYRGFRPYAPDHLPVIGADPRVPGLYHACGHEGAGIGLAPATGAILAAQLAGKKPPLDPAPFRPERFT
jgi:glycine/D-amino acid oxidase-like deaminating enzyme